MLRLGRQKAEDGGLGRAVRLGRLPLAASLALGRHLLPELPGDDRAGGARRAQGQIQVAGGTGG